MKLRSMATTTMESTPVFFFYQYQWEHWNLDKKPGVLLFDVPFRKPGLVSGHYPLLTSRKEKPLEHRHFAQSD